MTNGAAVFSEYMKDRNGGLPWCVILDGEGKELVTSNDSKGANVGCPVTPAELEHFVTMIMTSSDQDDTYKGKLEAALNAHAEKINASRR